MSIATCSDVSAREEAESCAAAPLLHAHSTSAARRPQRPQLVELEVCAGSRPMSARRSSRMTARG
eukprot:16439564-Heterocapsa_arctica.AAC.2